MRVLFVASKLDLPESHLIAGLAHAGLEATAILGPERRHAATLEAAGVTVHTRRWSRAPWSLGRRELREWIAAASPQIVHAFDNAALYDARKALPTGAAWIIYRGAPFISRRAARLYRTCPVARIVCVNHSIQQTFEQQGWPAARLTTIYKGHAPDWYRPAPPERLRALGLPPGARCIGSAARWRDWKNGPVLVEAFQRLTPPPDLHLLMVGEVCDPALERLRRALPPDPRVHFTGPQPDAAALLGACEIMVMPSNEQEGLCKAVLEAMIQGVPAVVSNVGGSAEIVRDGVEGLRTPPGDPAALAAALQRLVDDPTFRQACGQRARQRVETAFSIRETIARYQALYADLVPGG
jgi:glycosyltransferase involved in cell wall biosynthesis